jgi:uncharacterized RDD family membrane protein YckC
MKKRGDKFFLAPASIPKRIFAFIIDILILDLFVLFPFDRLVRKIIPAGTFSQQQIYIQSNPLIISKLYSVLIMMSLITVFYFTYLQYKIQQTPGQILFGIYIVPETKLSYWNYLLSNITFLAAKIFIILWAVDFFYMLTSPKNQRFMQKLNHITVIQKYKIK